MKNSEAIMSVFDLCRKKVNMTERETFSWLSIPESFLDDDTLEVDDRYFRISGDCCMVWVSCVKKEFDRWGNSVERTLDLTRRNERRMFIDMVEEWSKRGVEFK